MADTKPICCERCGAPSHVRLSNMYDTVFFCLNCYDKQCETGANPLSGGRAFDAVRLRGQIASAMVVVGTVIASGTAAADFLQVGNSEGFGWKQALTFVVGLMLMGSGTLFRIGVLGGVGGICVFMAVFADRFIRVGDAGFAFQRTVGITIAAILIGMGTVVARKTVAEPENTNADDVGPGSTPLNSLQTPAH